MPLLRPSPLVGPLLVVLFLAAAGGCRGGVRRDTGGRHGGATEIIAIDGSSTVYLITEAVAEEFRTQAETRVTIGVSGSGGGFKKLCLGEIAMTGASRPVKPSEVALCQEHGVSTIELPVAYDGIAVVVHPGNDWVDHLTVAELRRLWEPDAQDRVRRWSEIRTGWPDEEIHLFGPGVDSGTYDYFTKAIVGTEHASRGDFTSSEDDNVLVQGVARDRLALGFFGFAYYAENRDRLRLIPVDDGDPDNGDGPIAASLTSVEDGTYQPLSRPVFLYVSRDAADRPEVEAFVTYYLQHAGTLASEVGYIALPARAYDLSLQRFERRVEGSIFDHGGAQVGVTVEQLLDGS